MQQQKGSKVIYGICSCYLDINECEEHGRCSQRCYNEEGHYKCKCDNNYVQSTTDEKVCEEKGKSDMYT